MRGTKAKALRKVARQRAFAGITAMLGKPYRVKPIYAKNPITGALLEDENGKEIELMPASVHYTLYWPFMHFRRQLKFLKRGERITGLQYMGGGNG